MKKINKKIEREIDCIANCLTYRTQDFLDNISQGMNFNFNSEEKTVRKILRMLVKEILNQKLWKIQLIYLKH